LGKPVLRAIYDDLYRRIAQRCYGGPTLEIGGGSGNLKAFAPQVIASDILSAPWLDVVADAHRLPFVSGSIGNVVVFDVLHHLERPRLFLVEAERVLRPGGRIVMVEPAITPVSWPFYRFLHPEPMHMGVDPLAEGALDPQRDPYDSNQAVPTLLFGRHCAALSRAVPGMKLIERRFVSLFAYPLSGGFRNWSLLPAWSVKPLLRLEHALEPILGPLAAFRLIAVLEKQDPTSGAPPSPAK
jgi:SAM-dependent methyltransferase